MPSRIYRGKFPPSRLDHLLSHPYEITFAIFGLLACLAILAGELTPAVTVSASIDALHGIVAWSVGILGIAGNPLIVAGLMDDSADLMDGWRRERTGLYLAITSWGVYAIAVLAVYPGSVISWAIGATVALAHGLRLRATYAEEDQTRQSVERHEEDA